VFGAILKEGIYDDATLNGAAAAEDHLPDGNKVMAFSASQKRLRQGDEGWSRIPFITSLAHLVKSRGVAPQLEGSFRAKALRSCFSRMSLTALLGPSQSNVRWQGIQSRLHRVWRILILPVAGADAETERQKPEGFLRGYLPPLSTSRARL